MRLFAGLSRLPHSLRTIFVIALFIFIFTSLAYLFDLNERFMVEVPRRGGSISEGIIGRPRFVNPVIAKSDADRDMVALVYSGLLRATPEGNFIPDLAELYDISEDGLTYTFTLRDELVWHDGEPVTSADVAFTIEKVRDSGLAIKSPRRASWEGVEILTPDQRTIEFKLKQPYAPFLDNATMGILPKHIWENVPNDEFDVTYYNIEPIGSGPYRITSITKDNEKGLPRWYDLVAFKKYALGEPYVTRLRIMFFGNNSELAAAFSEGRVDQINSVEPAVAEGLTKAGATISSSPLPRVFAAFFNQNQQPIFADISVRSALSSAIDRDIIIAEVLRGYGKPALGALPASLAAPQDTASATVFASATDKVSQARAILEKGGWAPNASGVYEKTDKKKKTVTLLSFSIATPDVPELVAAATLLKWEKVGADVSLKVFEPSTFAAEVLAPRKYDAVFYGQITSRIPDPYAYWHSSQRNAPGLNIALYANKNVDKFLEEARRESDPNERDVLLGKFTAEMAKDSPAVFVYSPDFLYATSPKVRGITAGLLTVESERFLDISNWFVESEKVWKFFVK
jgi:peptide/nickel transport system substrate-binding protein